MEYEEDEFLQLSGLQHFKFCRRQWALIHIEALWEENLRTVDGALLHENAHNKDFRESRGDTLIRRGVRVFSASLGVSGDCDVLEFHRAQTGIAMAGRSGLWQPFPVEYKRGAPNPRSGDAWQLCGQAICLEQMLCCDIPEGAVYYGETRRRETVAFTPELRAEVIQAVREMHELYEKGHTPSAKRTKSCNACSLKELCLPELSGGQLVCAYLRTALEESL